MLATKNGMPYVREAVDSLRAQTFRDFELIVQDGGSTDGTAEYLAAVTDLPAIDVVSEPDRGLGDAYNRAIARCRGAIVGTIDSDNLLLPHALEDAVALFEADPTCAALYGAVRLIDQSGQPLEVFRPAEFDVIRLLRAELVPPFSTGFFARERCGERLRWDDRYSTCHDLDLWLRLSPLNIRRADEIIATVRLSPDSLTRRPENYDLFCEEKISAVTRFLEQWGEDPIAAHVRNESIAGIYCWAAESVDDLKGPTPQFLRYVELAAAHESSSRRVDRLLRRAAAVSAPGSLGATTPDRIANRARAVAARLLDD